MAKPRLYLETTIPSYLTAWPSCDPYVVGQQQITKDWWRKYRDDFDICVSQFVWMEAAAGDSDAAEKQIIKVVRKICARHGVECPQIHTPAELMGN